MAKRSKRTKPNPWMRDARDPDLPLWDSGSSPLALWREGVGLPLLVAIFGLFPLLTGHFEMPVRGGKIILDGGSARALGIAAIAFGACLHFHHYWGMSETLSDYSQAAMIVAALVFVGMLGYIAYFAIF